MCCPYSRWNAQRGPKEGFLPRTYSVIVKYTWCLCYHGYPELPSCLKPQLKSISKWIEDRRIDHLEYGMYFCGIEVADCTSMKHGTITSIKCSTSKERKVTI
jgi:hypothetical protein